MAAEGAWGSAAAFLSVVFAGLLAMNFFEPLANLLESLLPGDWAARTDFISLLVLFGGGVFLLRLASERLVPNFIAVDSRLYDVCRFGIRLDDRLRDDAGFLAHGLAHGSVAACGEFLGFTPERKNLFGFTAPDREWLGFVQFASEKSLQSSEKGRVFDGTRFDIEGHDNQIWPTFIIRYASRRDAVSPVLRLDFNRSPP